MNSSAQNEYFLFSVQLDFSRYTVIEISRNSIL